MSGIDKVLTEKAADMDNKEFFLFVAQVNRAMAIANSSIGENN